MKKLLLLICVTILINQAHSQDQKTDPGTSGEKFFIGLSYSYMSFDMKLTDLSLHSEWYGQDLGTHDLTSEEIDDINSFAERTTTVNTICVEAGMPLLNKPGSKWRIDGTLILGIAQTEKRTYNKNSETEEFQNVDTTPVTITLSGYDLMPGIYFARIRAGNQQLVKKVMIR